MSSLGAALRRQSRKSVTEAYKAYVSDPVANQTLFFSVIFDFALVKIGNATFDVSLGTDTAQDHAQEVAIYIWNKLGSFQGTPDVFYSWLHRICFTKGAKAFKEYVKEDELREELHVPSVDGGGFLDDNPVLSLWERDPVPVRELPAFITGVNLLICQYIREGLGYPEIGVLLSLSTKAVEKRVEKLKHEVEKRNVQSQKAAS